MTGKLTHPSCRLAIDIGKQYKSPVLETKMSDESGGKGSWWATVPGILTATAGVITAVTGLTAILSQTGVLGEKSKGLVAEQSTAVRNAISPPEAPASKPSIPADARPANATPANARTTPGVETGISSGELRSLPFTGAILTLSDGSVIKLRGNIREYCHSSASLYTRQGQAIEMSRMTRFDVLDWYDQKGKVKISLTSGEVLNADIEGACSVQGRNDLGDFAAGFDKIRSVEFVR